MNGRQTLRVLLLCAGWCAGCARESTPDPAQEAEGHYLKGTTEYLHGNFDVALAELAQVRRLNPGDPRLPAATGEVYLSQGKLPEALKEYQAAVARDPRRATNWSRLGSIQAQLGDSEAARASLERAISLNPKDFNALEARAELHAKAGELDAAVRDYAAAGRASPELARAGLYLHAVSLLERKGRRREALAVLEDAVQGGVKDSELFSLLGELRVKEGQLPGAADAYRQAAALSPKDPGHWELVGRIEARLGRPEQAAEAYRKSLEVKERAVVHVALARLALERADRESARAELDKALAAGASEDATAAETQELAELLLAFDRKQDALRLYQLLSAEPEGLKDADLQRRTARLARELKALPALKTACERVTALEGKAAKCP